MELSPATAENAAVDIPCLKSFILMPGEEPTLIKRDIYGPLPSGTVGLLLGRLSLTSQGVRVHTGVIDSDYMGEIKIMMSSAKPWKAEAGDQVAQTLLLPFCPLGKSDKLQGDKVFGSTGEAGVFLTEKILYSCPVCTIKIQDKIFKGLIDTGADISIINSRHWPARWPTQLSDIDVIGLGRAQGLKCSSLILNCKGPDGQSAKIQPYVAELPINLWGRDLLQQWQAKIYIPSPCQYSTQSQAMMAQHGYLPGLGLGKENQGITQPLEPKAYANRAETGYHPLS